MSVRQSLLALLTLGPCYGYQLRAEYTRRTGASRELNVGQIYNTLERLERDGLVATGETDAQGHVYYDITDAGRAEAERWLSTPSVGLGLEELAAKLALAASLPGTDAATLVAAERAAAATADTVPSDAPAGLGPSLAAAAATAAASARRDLLDAAAELLTRYPDTAVPLAPSRPRRGRPTRAVPPSPESAART